jgi:hypothetical protein
MNRGSNYSKPASKSPSSLGFDKFANFQENVISTQPHTEASSPKFSLNTNVNIGSPVKIQSPTAGVVVPKIQDEKF